MKNGKKPTRYQKVLIQSHGLDPDNWLVVKDQIDKIEVISRNELAKTGTKKLRTRFLLKSVI